MSTGAPHNKPLHRGIQNTWAPNHPFTIRWSQTNCHFRAQTSTSHPCNWGPWWRSSGPPSSRTWSWVQKGNISRLSATVEDHECPQWPPFCLISSFHKAYISLPWLRFPKCFMISHGTALSSTLRNNRSRAWGRGKVNFFFWSAAINSARVGGRHWSGGCRNGDTWNCKIAQSNNKFLWNVSIALGSFTHVIYVHIMYMNAGAGSDSYVGSSPSAVKRYSCSVVMWKSFMLLPPRNLN